MPEEEPTALPIPEHAEIAAEGHEPALEEPQAALPEAPPPQPELELDQEFELVLEPEEVIPAHEMLSQIPPSPPPKPAEARRKKKSRTGFQPMSSSDQFLSDLAREIDELGLDELTPGMSKPNEPAPAEAPSKETVGAVDRVRPVEGSV